MKVRQLAAGFLPEAARFAAAAVVFTGIQPLLPKDWPFIAEQGMAFLAAVVAFLFTAIVAEVLIGKPELIVSWDVGGHLAPGPVSTLDFRSTPTHILAVAVSFKGTTMLSSMMRRRSTRRPVALQVRFSPRDYVYLSGGRLPRGVSIDPTGEIITIRFVDGFVEGPIVKSEIVADERIISSGVCKMHCHIEFDRSITGFYFRWLVRVTYDLTAFEIRK